MKALIKSGKEENFDFKILEPQNTSIKTKVILVDEIEKYFGGNIEGKRLQCGDWLFKANTDDIREASSFRQYRTSIRKKELK